MKKINLVTLLILVSFFSSSDVISQCLWSSNSYGLYYNTAGKRVGIGCSTVSNGKLQIISDIPYAIYTQNIYTTTVAKYGIHLEISGSSTDSYGYNCTVSSTNGNKYGLRTNVSGVGNRYGIYSECESNTGKSWAGYFKNGMIELESGLFITGNYQKKWSFEPIQISYPTGNINAIRLSPSLSIPNYTWDTDNSFTFTEQGTILVKNKIGIGPLTSDPTEELDVQGDIILSGAIYGKISHTENWNKLELKGSSNTNAGYIEVGDGSTNWNCVKISGPGQGGSIQFFADAGLSMEVRNNEVLLGSNKIVDLKVNGKVFSNEVKVSLDSWHDYVFNTDFKLMSLKSLAEYISINKHLPDIPTAKEVDENGINVGEMNALLLKKVEELTLYIIKQQEQLDKQQSEIDQLKQR